MSLLLLEWCPSGTHGWKLELSGWKTGEPGMRTLDGSVSAVNADSELAAGRALDVQEPRQFPKAW